MIKQTKKTPKVLLMSAKTVMYTGLLFGRKKPITDRQASMADSVLLPLETLVLYLLQVQRR